jgi:uncharacterized membrane protein YfcA
MPQQEVRDMNPVWLVMIGVAVGVFSGVMGLGGGSVMIPVMVLCLGMTQPEAHGTSLAVMIPPVTLPAVIEYYRKGNVRLGVAGWMAGGVLAGSLVGALIANSIPKETLKLVFGLLLIYVAGYTIFGKQNLIRTTLLSLGLVAVAGIALLALRHMDRPADASPAASTDTVARP